MLSSRPGSIPLILLLLLPLQQRPQLAALGLLDVLPQRHAAPEHRLQESIVVSAPTPPYRLSGSHTAVTTKNNCNKRDILMIE